MQDKLLLNVNLNNYKQLTCKSMQYKQYLVYCILLAGKLIVDLVFGQVTSWKMPQNG